MERIKKFSLIIITTIIMDLLVNIFLPNKDNFQAYSTEDNIILNGLISMCEEKKETDSKKIKPIPRQMISQITRVAKNRNVSSTTVIRQMADKILFFDNELSKHCIKRFIEKEYGYHINVYENTINNAGINKFLGEVSKISDKNLINIAKKLKIYKYKVHFVTKKKSNYIVDSLCNQLIQYKNIRSVFDRLIRKGSSFEMTSAERELHEQGDLIILLGKLKTKHFKECDFTPNVNSSIGQLYFDNEAQATFLITPKGLRLLSFIDPDRRRYSRLPINQEVIKSSSLCCYVFNKELNKHYFELKEEDILYIGDIYHADVLRGYNPMAGIIKFTIEEEKLNYILESVDPEVWNNSQQMTIVTPVGTYRLQREICEDLDVIRQVYAIYTSANFKVSEAVSNPRTLMIPSNYITEFKDFYQCMFGHEFNTKIKSQSYIDYNRKKLVTLDSVKSHQNFYIQHPNHNLIKLIYDGHIFE